MENHGTIRINLQRLIEERGLSKNKVCHAAQMERTQLNKYCNNVATRLDTDVLARLCHALNCSVDDLLEYVPPEK